MRHTKLGEFGPETARRIKAIRDRIDEAKIPPSCLDENMIIGTWNVRNLGKSPRLADSKRIIAEIIGQFDLVALTEVRDDLSDLDDILDVLGPYWRCVYSDYRSDAAGNRERIAYVYDKRMLVFTGLAAEADPPRYKEGDDYRLQHPDWWRSPYMASFRAGNFDFVMMTAHIRYSGGVRRRAKEIGALADWVEDRRTAKAQADKDFILVGDFNIPSRRSAAYKALTKHSLQAPAGLVNITGTNLKEDKFYDQIVHSPTRADRFTGKGGLIRFYEESHTELFPDLSLHEFKEQISDHYPLWLSVDTWIEGEQLDAILQAEGHQ